MIEKPSTVGALRISRIILYVKDIPRVAAFYERHFGMHPLPGGTSGWLELDGPQGGCTIALHKASAAQKSGAAIKLVFGIATVRAFKSAKEKDGLKFGVVHEADGFEFSNAKDPAGNSIQISSRGIKGPAETTGIDDRGRAV
jgi:catechol 2,3-dioxygenase-like lactoylglutathione lyase family enzyme